MKPVATPTPDAADLVVPAEYPELRRLAWNRDPVRPIAGKEALQIYEAAWRHVDEDAMPAAEKALVQRLATQYGNGHLLVPR